MGKHAFGSTGDHAPRFSLRSTCNARRLPLFKGRHRTKVLTVNSPGHQNVGSCFKKRGIQHAGPPCRKRARMRPLYDDEGTAYSWMEVRWTARHFESMVLLVYVCTFCHIMLFALEELWHCTSVAEMETTPPSAMRNISYATSPLSPLLEVTQMPVLHSRNAPELRAEMI